MKLQSIFSKDDWTICMSKIKRREFFDISLIQKPYKFQFAFRECNNGLWKDNVLVSINMSYKSGGYGYGKQIDELPSYEELCREVNDYWVSEEKWYGDYKPAQDNFIQISFFDEVGA